MSNIVPISIWPAGIINSFLIKGKSKHILVDAGVPDSEEKIIRQVKQHGINPRDISLLIVTHGHIDHFGSASRIKELLSIPILAHANDAETYRTGRVKRSQMQVNKPQWALFRMAIANQQAQPFEPDHLMINDVPIDLQPWGIDGRVIYTPGHTPGSLSVVLDTGEAIIMDMLSSGILLGGIAFHSRVKHPPFHDDLHALRHSFDKVLKENVDRYYLGHGGPVNRTQVQEYYDRYLVHR